MSADQAVAARAASLLLRYPDPTVHAALPTLRAAVAALPARLREPLERVAEHYARTPPAELETSYVDTFDFRRRCCLHLTYYVHGDTRARGAALVGMAGAYREAGLALDGGELPDHLPAVLDLAATAGEPGWRLLREHRVGLDLLHAALEREGSIYAHTVEAVRRLLPAPGPAELAAATRLAGTGPAVEWVGLEPYGSRRQS